MHNAPAVSYPAGRSSFTLAALSVLWLVATAGIALWSAQGQAAPGRIGIAFAAVMFTGAIALRGWLRSAAGILSWDGQGWTWSSVTTESYAGTPEVALDAQRLLLLRWQGARRVRWLWLERGARPAQWDDLRRAVYSRARPEAPAGAQAPGEAKS